MTPEQRALESQILYMNLVDYWYEVDIKGGAGVSAMYTEDCIFDGGGKPLVGREAIEQFYAWRRARGERTSRHVVVNFRAVFDDPTHATTHCVMMLHAADGPPVHPSMPAIMTTDLIDRCVKGEDGVWRCAERRFVALFMGGNAPTVPPETIADSYNKAPAEA